MGGQVDADDVLRAARALGVGIGGTVEPSDVARVAARARRAIAPVAWVLGGEYGATVDDVDLARAAARLDVNVGASIEPADAVRIVAAARPFFAQEAARDISPGLRYDRWRARLRDGAAVVHVLRWQLSDRRVALRPELTGRWGRKATVPQLAARRAGRGAVAVVNGGFWSDGDVPDGLLVAGGALLSDPTIGKPWVRGPRGTFALVEDGYAVGRPKWEASLAVPGVGDLSVRGVNRPLGSDDVVVYSRAWGREVVAPVTVTLPAVALAPHLEHTGAVAAVGAGRASVPEGGVVVAATGRAAEQLAAAVAGAPATLRVQTPSWVRADAALAGGPLLVTDAVPTRVEDWQSEGFGPRHNAVRHPRTVVGFTPEGEALLVVVDGRRPGYSSGMTTAESAALMRALGARDAVMLDGGGSSHMVLRGGTVNRPCCDGRPRPVTTALVLYAR